MIYRVPVALRLQLSYWLGRHCLGGFLADCSRSAASRQQQKLFKCALRARPQPWKICPGWQNPRVCGCASQLEDKIHRFYLEQKSLLELELKVETAVGIGNGRWPKLLELEFPKYFQYLEQKDVRTAFVLARDSWKQKILIITRKYTVESRNCILWLVFHQKCLWPTGTSLQYLVRYRYGTGNRHWYC